MEKDDIYINCDGLVKIYKSKDVEVMALQGIDLKIKKGELIAIVGKSGSGKSTLMNMLGGLEEPTAGKLFVEGRNLFAINSREMSLYRKNTIGFVWQMSQRNLLPYLTARKNIELIMQDKISSSRGKRERAFELLDMVGLLKKADSYPAALSGGEQQRVAIAAALANNPDIILADEPTGAVDSKTAKEIQSIFRRLKEEQGKTVIIVTHDMKLAAGVDRVLQISDGKISTEKVKRDEYSVLDRADRVKLSEEMLLAAGIDGKRVKIKVEDKKIIITK